MQHINDSQDWIIDSVANAYITSFKEHLHNYHEYSNQDVQVKGFAGKAEIVRGKGTITLTDNAGNRLTLKDVVYVPESPDQILSLMKLRREHQADFHFIAIEKFVISLPNDVSFIGKSVNDICHIWTSSLLQINAVSTRSASKKRKHDNNDNDQPSPSNITASTPSSSNSPSIQPLQYSPQNL